MRNRNPVLSLSALSWALLLGGCATGPDYAVPETPEKVAASFVSTGDTSTVAPLPDAWWRLYEDPVLDQLVQQALEANTDLRVAAANLERARAVLTEVGNIRFPSSQVSLGATYGDNTSSTGQGMALPDRQWSTTGGLAVAWEVDLLGRVRRTLEAAQADYETVEAARDGVRATVVAEVTRSYITAASLAESVAVVEESISLARQTLELTQQQERVGAASRFDVERAAATLASTRAALPPLQARRQNALFALAALLGLPPSDVPAVAVAREKAPALSAPVPVEDGAALLRRRPDLRQAERRLAADTARIGVATADLYPRVSLNGALNYLRNDLTRGGDSWTFGVGPLLSWSFPNIGVARSRIKQSEAQVQASLASFEGAVLNALREVEQALTTLNAEQQRHIALAEADQRTRTAYDLADARYRAGSISYFELLQANRDRVEARAALAESGVSLNAARVDLFKALGGGWSGPDAHAAADAGPRDGNPS